ncbi:hypothetical protein OC834_001710 [Tilletia horrida]|uniref:C2H2-type domain-containing protein n=1 Tax=Tilletia horrida TaxID=155126 RepID=A0AAN6GHC5_9BASI|nr:hypothetical protein OC834_001710 [Tilletia horrida]KAK0536118.1 hypothetical protein OC835_002132 [Tilletia horrida]KAK0537354.1 hypothetical protein OC842_001662 [Tilletia horrida]KAK0558717.1 hypothetical protein OC844_004935 [Tilletia horrida]
MSEKAAATTTSSSSKLCYSVVRIVKEAGISVELAKRCAADLGVPIKSASTSSTSATPTAGKAAPSSKPAPIVTSIKTAPAPVQSPVTTSAAAASSATSNKSAANEEPKHLCPYGCGNSYRQKSGLDYHINKGKCEVRDGLRSAAGASSTPKIHKCKAPGCSAVFTTSNGLLHHYNNNHGSLGQELARALVPS